MKRDKCPCWVSRVESRLGFILLFCLFASNEINWNGWHSVEYNCQSVWMLWISVWGSVSHLIWMISTPQHVGVFFLHSFSIYQAIIRSQLSNDYQYSNALSCAVFSRIACLFAIECLIDLLWKHFIVWIHSRKQKKGLSFSFNFAILTVMPFMPMIIRIVSARFSSSFSSAIKPMHESLSIGWQPLLHSLNAICVVPSVLCERAEYGATKKA